MTNRIVIQADNDTEYKFLVAASAQGQRYSIRRQ